MRLGVLRPEDDAAALRTLAAGDGANAAGEPGSRSGVVGAELAAEAEPLSEEKRGGDGGRVECRPFVKRRETDAVAVDVLAAG